MKKYITKIFVLGVFWGVAVTVWAQEGYQEKLIQAVYSGDIGRLEALLPPVLLPHLINERDLLHFAAAQGNAEIMDLFLERGAAIDDCNESGLTPLHIAALMNHPEAVLVLLLRGADATLRSDSGDTAEESAVRLSNEGVMDVFRFTRRFHEGEPLNPDSRSLKSALLHYSAAKGYLLAARLLLEELSTDVDALLQGFTPLHGAAFEGQQAMVMLLLNHGANVNAARFNGCTALFYAVLGGHADVVDYLLCSGANIEAIAIWRGIPDPLHLAVILGHEEVVRVLLRRGANYNKRMPDGRSLAAFALKAGHHPIYDLLLLAEIEDEIQQKVAINNGTQPCAGKSAVQVVRKPLQWARL